MARQSFFVVVHDKGRKVFSVHGPMIDDTHITNRVGEAQKAGREINCSTSHHPSWDVAVQVADESFYPSKRVPSAL